LSVGRGVAALVCGVEAVAEEVQKGARDVLRHYLERGNHSSKIA
jgi:hypothetical protein